MYGTNKREERLANFAEGLKGYGATTSHRSPLYGVLAPQGAAALDPACATCPAGMWLATDALICFCKVMKQYTWGLDRAPVLACDERERLLTEIDDA